MILTDENFAIVERDTHIGKWVMESKRLDFDQNALPTYLKYFNKNDVLLNVGANIGCYAYAFIDKAKEIVCIEPNDEAFECLQFNLSSYKNIILLHTAVSNKQHPYTIHNEYDNVGMAYVEERISDKYTITIDDLKMNQLNFILMDCEGYELKALEGAEKTINQFKPIMVIEINNMTLERTNTTREDIFNWLINHGYKFRNIYIEQDLKDSQLDILCFPI